MPGPDLTIVIVSFQVRDLLESCLNSILGTKSDLTLEIVVVDNASSDGTVDLLRREFPQVNLIANKVNLGFSKANNQALEVAAGRYNILLNPDTVLPAGRPCAFDILVDFMDGRPAAGACGPSLRYSDGSFQHSAFRFPSLAQLYVDLFPANWRLARSSLNGRYSTRLYGARKPFRVDHPLGAAFMVRRSAAEAVGHLDEGFFIYAEEIDWAIRLRRSGWEIWCLPGVEIIHLEAMSTGQFRDSMFVELWKARLYLFRKHYSPSFNMTARILLFAGMQLAERNARKSYTRGEISAEALEQRLDAYRTVQEMSRPAG